jgi:hypothetical protein
LCGAEGWSEHLSGDSGRDLTTSGSRSIVLEGLLIAACRALERQTFADFSCSARR